MPLYEFRCGKCQGESELLIRSSEKPICPECGSGTMEKLLSAVAVHSTDGNSLPICEAPRGASPGPGGCGAPWCGQGGCGS